MLISDHQKRVLAALLELEQAHAWRWWSRQAIGFVVDAGGYHGTLQMGTVAALKAGGFIQTELSSWPPNIRALVKCGCAAGEWGLTNKGRTMARRTSVRWDEESRKRIDGAKFYGSHFPGRDPIDEDDARANFRRRMQQRDDEDDGEGWKHV